MNQNLFMMHKTSTGSNVYSQHQDLYFSLLGYVLCCCDCCGVQAFCILSHALPASITAAVASVVSFPASITAAVASVVSFPARSLQQWQVLSVSQPVLQWQVLCVIVTVVGCRPSAFRVVHPQPVSLQKWQVLSVSQPVLQWQVWCVIVTVVGCRPSAFRVVHPQPVSLQKWQVHPSQLEVQ